MTKPKTTALLPFPFVFCRASLEQPLHPFRRIRTFIPYCTRSCGGKEEWKSACARLSWAVWTTSLPLSYRLASLKTIHVFFFSPITLLFCSPPAPPPATV